MPGMRTSSSTMSGVSLSTSVERLLAIAGLARDLEFAGLRQHGAQPLARRRLVVDDEHAQAHAVGLAAGVNGKAQRHDVFLVEAAGLDRGALAVHEIEPFLDVGERQPIAIAHGEVREPAPGCARRW